MKKDDPTIATGELRDYPNTYFNYVATIELGRKTRHDARPFKPKEMRAANKSCPIETVDEYLERQKSQTSKAEYWSEFEKDMQKFPDRVKRLNDLATIMRTCVDYARFREIWKEMWKLIYARESSSENP